MSTKNAKEFLELIKTDERLAKEVTDLMSSIKADVKPCNEKRSYCEKCFAISERIRL